MSFRVFPWLINILQGGTNRYFLIYRYIQYNNSLKYVDELEAQNKAFVIRPKDNLDMGRVERDKQKLKNTYDLGYKDAVELKDKLFEFLS